MTAGLDAVPGGVLTLSPDLHIRAANAAMADMVGRPAGDLVGTRFDECLTAPSRILLQSHVYPSLRVSGRVEEVFLTVVGPDGTGIPVLFNAAARGGETPDGYDCLVVRIADRTRWETELLAVTRVAERERAASADLASQLEATAHDLAERYEAERRGRAVRDAFAGIVSHELRTPITTIFGMSRILRQRHATMDRSAIDVALDDIASEADRLRRLTEDLLVLSRAEGEGLDLAEDPLLVGHVLRRVVAGERTRWPTHTFELTIDTDLPPVLGEELYLEQVMRNLLGNAAKYSPGETTVTTTARAIDDGVEVRVTDEGPGLGEGPPDRLFELFFRAPDARRHASGAGIGLFVSRELVRAMRGRIWARPAPAGGAEFGFWLPLLGEDPSAGEPDAS